MTGRVGDGGGGGRVVGDGVRVRIGEGGIVSKGLSAGAAWARSRDNEDGPAAAEFARVRTGNRWDVGDRVAPRNSAAEALGCGGSAGGGLIGRSGAGGIDALSDVFLADAPRRFVVVPGWVQSSTSSI